LVLKNTALTLEPWTSVWQMVQDWYCVFWLCAGPMGSPVE
jgi:hypothetical protein